MIIKIENLELIVNSFTVKYTDDFNELSFTYKTDDQSEVTKLKKSLDKDKFKVTTLNDSHNIVQVMSKSIATKSNSHATTFKLKLKY